MPAYITLPAETETVATADIPALIACALHPDASAQQLTVSYFTKTAKPGARGPHADWRGWPIREGDEEWRTLEEIWAHLPILRPKATREEVAPYLEAFAAKGDSLDWELGIVWTNPGLNAGMLRAQAEVEHRQAIVVAIRGGKLRVLSPTSMVPTDEMHPASRVTVESLRRYVADFQIDLRTDPSDSLTPIGLIAHNAAMLEHPPVPGEDGMRRDIRNAMRETTEKDFLRRLTEYVRQGTLRAANPINGAPYDPALPHLDPADPMWAVDATEREHALELLGQLVRTEAGSRTTVTIQSITANEAEARELQERQARGFYTLQEAARKISDSNPNVNQGKLLADMFAAARERELVIRDPATQAPVRDTGSVRDFWHWVTPTDVDALFAAWGVQYRFPAHDGAGPVNETKEQRRERLHAHYDEMKGKGIKDFAKRVAEAEGITTGRLRQLLSEGKEIPKAKAKTRGPFDV